MNEILKKMKKLTEFTFIHDDDFPNLSSMEIILVKELGMKA